VAQITQGYIQDERALNLEAEKSKIVEARQLRLDEAKERLRRTGDEYDWGREQARTPIKNQMARENALGVMTDKQNFENEHLGEMARNRRELARATDFDAGDRSLRNEKLGLEIEEARRASGDKAKLRAAVDELYAADTPEKEVAARKKINALKGGDGDPLSARISAAKAILADLNATDEQKEVAIDFLKNALGTAAFPSARSGALDKERRTISDFRPSKKPASGSSPSPSPARPEPMSREQALEADRKRVAEYKERKKKREEDEKAESEARKAERRAWAERIRLTHEAQIRR
jgi:hypothetical protein